MEEGHEISILHYSPHLLQHFTVDKCFLHLSFLLYVSFYLPLTWQKEKTKKTSFLLSVVQYIDTGFFSPCCAPKLILVHCCSELFLLFGHQGDNSSLFHICKSTEKWDPKVCFAMFKVYYLEIFNFIPWIMKF